MTAHPCPDSSQPQARRRQRSRLTGPRGAVQAAHRAEPPVSWLIVIVGKALVGAGTDIDQHRSACQRALQFVVRERLDDR